MNKPRAHAMRPWKLFRCWSSRPWQLPSATQRPEQQRPALEQSRAFDTSKPLVSLANGQKSSTLELPKPTGKDTDSELSAVPTATALGSLQVRLGCDLDRAPLRPRSRRRSPTSRG